MNIGKNNRISDLWNLSKEWESKNLAWSLNFMAGIYTLAGLLPLPLDIMIGFVFNEIDIYPALYGHLGMFFGYGIVFSISQLTKKKYSHNKSTHKIITTLILLAVMISVNLTYTYFAFIYIEYKLLIFSSIIMVLCTYWFIARLPRVFAVNCLLNSIMYCIAIYLYQNNLQIIAIFLNLVLFLAVVFFVGIIMNYNSIKQLIEKFKSISQIYTIAMAKEIVMAPHDINFGDYKARNRPVLIFVADLRNWQHRAQSSRDEDAQKFLNIFHTKMKKLFTKAIPNQTFNYEWVADMAFVTVYSDHDSEQDLVKKAQCVISSLLGIRLTRSDPDFDFGITMGNGNFGLQGPLEAAKMTTSGKIGGIAKRLEEEGKAIREELQKTAEQRFFVLAMSRDLAKKLHLRCKFREAISKNIAGENIAYLVVSAEEKRRSSRE